MTGRKWSRRTSAQAVSIKGFGGLGFESMAILVDTQVRVPKTGRMTVRESGKNVCLMEVGL